MPKDPAFLFYPGDWLQGTMGLSFQEKGAYMELLIFQFNNGKFTREDAKHILSTCKAYAFEKVLKKFDTNEDGTLFWKQRLVNEMKKRSDYTESRRNNARGIKNEEIDLPASIKNEAYAKHMENENENTINISKELCKIFGKEYQLPKERMPAMSNWYMTIDVQAKAILSVHKPEQAINQIRGYVRYCKSNDRKLIGTNYKVAETILGSNWIELLGENVRAPDKFEKAAYNKSLWTVEAWEETYKKQLSTNPDFREYFGYGKLSNGLPVGSKVNG